MSNFLYFLILGAIFITAAFVCTKNYKNRAKSIGNNLLEYCYYIVEHYNKLQEEEKIKLTQLLDEKELMLFNQLISKTPSLGKNLNVLQGQMFILESIYGKIKTIEN